MKEKVGLSAEACIELVEVKVTARPAAEENGLQVADMIAGAAVFDMGAG